MSLTLDLNKAAARFKADSERKLRATCLGLSSSIIKRTPVGNPDYWESPAPPGYIGGTLRNSWHGGVNAAEGGGARSPSEGGNESVQSASSATARLKLGDRFYLKNDLPYAQRVEDGWSTQQAPAGMVKITIAEAKMKAEGQFRG